MRNNKNQLFNDILHFLDLFAVIIEKSNKDELKRLVVLLQDTFWHIDGHHHVTSSSNTMYFFYRLQCS